MLHVQQYIFTNYKVITQYITSTSSYTINKNILNMLKYNKK